MLSLLDVVSFMKDKESALAFLRSVPKPFRSQDVRLASGYDLPFDVADIKSLISLKRHDLAELVLERTNDMNLLYEVSRLDVTASITKAICRNYNVPVPLLLDIHLDERKTAQAAARSALARHLGVALSDADEAISVLRDILYCDEADLPKLLDRANLWRDKTTQVAYALAFERPGGLSDALRESILTSEIGMIARNANGPLAKAIVDDPRTTVDEIELIIAKAPGYGTKTTFYKGLLSRLEPNTPAWIEALVACTDYGAHSPNEHARALHHEAAMTLLTEGGRGAEMALQSGQLRNKDVKALVESWALATRRGKSSSVSVPDAIFAHPGVSGELLEELIGLASAHLPIRVPLAANPNLTAQAQFSMLGEDSTRRQLATNTAITREAAQALVNVLTDSISSNRGMLSWSNQTTLAALMANPSVPVDIKSSLPVNVARSGRLDSWLSSKHTAKVINSYLEGDAGKWRMFLDLLPEWEGSIRDLCLAVDSL